MIYQTKGTCAKAIKVELDNGIIRSVEFDRGCPGFTQAVSRLLIGMRAEDAITRLKGIPCLDKGTSCPDQLASALSLCLSQNGHQMPAAD